MPVSGVEKGPRLCVPELDFAVLASGADELAFRAEGHRRDGSVVPGEFELLGRVPHVPSVESPVLPDCQEELPVGAEFDPTRGGG